MENLPIDGDYQAEITLGGGTGRTTIQSPANVHVEDGVITAEIVWSSPNYDLMVVGDKEYKPISNDGRSVFMVEIPSLDTPLDIKAETVAMSAPHMIEYTITVSGREILQNENTSSSDSLLDFSGMTSEEISSIIDSYLSQPYSGTGSNQTIFSATVADPDNNKSSIPPLAVIGISAALGAAVAFVAVNLRKNKKK